MKHYKSTLKHSGSTAIYHADGSIEEITTYSNEEVKMTNPNLKYIMTFLGVLLCVFLCACTPSPNETSKNTAQDLVDALTFVKDKHGICYGVVSVSKSKITYKDYAMSRMLIVVDCQKVGL